MMMMSDNTPAGVDLSVLQQFGVLSQVSFSGLALSSIRVASVAVVVVRSTYHGSLFEGGERDGVADG